MNVKSKLTPVYFITAWHSKEKKKPLNDFNLIRPFKNVFRNFVFGFYLSICKIYLFNKMSVDQNQIKSLLLSHHHSTCALVSDILESVLQTVQKQLTYRQYHYILTDLYR